MEVHTQELLKTLSNKTNLEIINLLRNEPSYPRKISEILGMQEGYISRILSNLEKMGILRSQWAYRERNVKLYYVDTKEISIAFEPEGLKLCVKTKGEKEVSVSYDAFKFEIPEAHGFINRRQELQSIDSHSIVVIEGLAGIGKTFLAAEYARSAQAKGKKIFWHSFTDIDSFHYVINKLSVFLNNVGLSNLLEYIKQEGRDSRVLISLFQQGMTEDMIFCFDGFQKVQDSELVTMFKLLKDPGAQIIITSRERPSFVTISRSDIKEIRLSAFTEKEARELLHSRGVILGDKMMKKAHKKLGGHPLMLDMFCEAAKEKQPRLVLDNLPGNQVEDYLWSEIFQTLSEEERKLVECLSMFRIPASVEILKKVCLVPGFWTCLKGLEKRMFIRRQDGGYVLPSSIVEFTYQRVPDEAQLHTEIADSYRCQGTPEGLLESMYHFLQGGNHEEAARLVAQPQDVDLIERGYLSPYLDILNGFRKSRVPSELWCSIMCAKGRILALYGDSKNALRAFEEMQKTARNINSDAYDARALHWIGNIYASKGDWKTAHTCFDTSLDILERLQEHKEMVSIHADIGLLLMKEGLFGEALSHFEAGKAIAEKSGFMYGLSQMLRGMANVYYYQDQFDTALQYHTESLTLAEEVRDVRGIAANFNTLGLIHFYKGDFEKAISCFKRTLNISERISDIRDQIISCGNLGMVYAEGGEGDLAENYYQRALQLAESLEDLYSTTYLKMKMAGLLLEKGELEKAHSLCEVCENMFSMLGKSLHHGEFCRIYAMVLQQRGEWERAKELYQKSIDETGGSPLELGKTYLEFGLGMKKHGAPEEAASYYEIALQLFQQISAEKEREKAQGKWSRDCPEPT
ncbi:MAG: tetratricopeptide repeat protein [Theionarchaea archaeon]|nr:tetratricopeptide repeat protein [Theionarchaea archaeon]MBU7000735.1 tetratricopeptide repeat protein [Theionarchaea archaeon]MBU7021482.1 tetratricopeptide repeat protein [Theionarchaea archaeon]MBU7033577.1 tetratricopeptide repeat protein [Theionarchaea archaeon]MBU7039613.1 tetratricopeptide repeat protein [Theionarchaea archaeon]